MQRQPAFRDATGSPLGKIPNTEIIRCVTQLYGQIIHKEVVIQTVQELDPDLILLGGDLVTFPNPEYEKMLSLCRSLADVAPLYGVLGNHESEMIYPGLLVTVGFIDPGNWASNMAAGSQFGYALLWIVTLSTIMLIVLQHNAAHLGIATGACLAEATTRYLPRFVGRAVLGSAYLATIATAMAEVLGGAIALQMLFGLPVRAGCVIVAAASMAMLFRNRSSSSHHPPNLP